MKYGPPITLCPPPRYIKNGAWNSITQAPGTGTLLSPLFSHMPKILSHPAKHWCFTLNNPTLNHEALSALFSGITSFLIFQREKGENNTTHFQGYFILQRKQRLSALKKLLPRAHFEVARGTPHDNILYCSKEDTRVSGPYQSGSPPARSKSDSLSLFERDVKRGLSIEELWEHHFSFMLRYHKSISSFRLATGQVSRGRPSVFIFFGAAGIGKSHIVRESYPEAYYKDVTSKWFDGYSGQSVIVFDDFYGGIQLTSLLSLIDYGKVALEFKGGYVPIVAETFVFTSNDPPERWYHSTTSGALKGWRRRLKEFSQVYTRFSLEDEWERIYY